jgi:carbonic anhydrase
MTLGLDDTTLGFDDLLAANEAYTRTFGLAGLPPGAARKLAVLTCMDSRIDPLGMFGLLPGDAKIIRNAGARVFDDALRSLIMAVHLLGVRRIAVVHHTQCAMHAADTQALTARVSESAGGVPCAMDLGTYADPMDALRTDLARIDDCDLLPASLGIECGGFLYSVETGHITRLL